MDLGLSYLVLQSGRKHRFSFVFQILPRRKGKVFSRPSRVFPNAFSVHLNLLLTSRSWGVQGKGSTSFFLFAANNYSFDIVKAAIHNARRVFGDIVVKNSACGGRTWLACWPGPLHYPFFHFFPPSRFLSVKKKLFPLYSEEKLG